ncbi:hypothetical protein HanIR_Chr15g0744721 [Helianthus annuus]|nr:hypothetical protein HanIR_Chr15g0744721 [Helianthus annuus]
MYQRSCPTKLLVTLRYKKEKGKTPKKKILTIILNNPLVLARARRYEEFSL